MSNLRATCAKDYFCDESRLEFLTHISGGEPRRQPEGSVRATNRLHNIAHRVVLRQMFSATDAEDLQTWRCSQRTLPRRRGKC